MASYEEQYAYYKKLVLSNNVKQLKMVIDKLNKKAESLTLTYGEKNLIKLAERKLNEIKVSGGSVD